MIYQYITYVLWAGLLYVCASVAIDVQRKLKNRIPSYFFPPLLLITLITFMTLGLAFVLIPLLVIPFAGSLIAKAVNARKVDK